MAKSNNFFCQIIVMRWFWKTVAKKRARDAVIEPHSLCHRKLKNKIFREKPAKQKKRANAVSMFMICAHIFIWIEFNVIICCLFYGFSSQRTHKQKVDMTATKTTCTTFTLNKNKITHKKKKKRERTNAVNCYLDQTAIDVGAAR